MVAEFILSATAEKRGTKMDAYFAFTDECGNYQKVTENLPIMLKNKEIGRII